MAVSLTDEDNITPPQLIQHEGPQAPGMPGPPTGYDPDLERLEIELLLEAIFRQYGFDFRSYAYASIRRRLWRRIAAEGLATISGLQDRLLHEPAMMEQLLLDLSINVTAIDRKSTRLNSSH